jgi:hypothetical protein
MAPSKVKNDKPDDFATYMAKRKAAAEGRFGSFDMLLHSIDHV